MKLIIIFISIQLEVRKDRTLDQILPKALLWTALNGVYKDPITRGHSTAA